MHKRQLFFAEASSRKFKKSIRNSCKHIQKFWIMIDQRTEKKMDRKVQRSGMALNPVVVEAKIEIWSMFNVARSLAVEQE